MVEDKKKRAKSESRDITIKYVDALAKASKEGDYLTSQSKSLNLAVYKLYSKREISDNQHLFGKDWI